MSHGFVEDETLQANGVEAASMEHDRTRGRIRISNVMLLVIILALVLTLAIELLNKEREVQQAQAEAAVARQKAAAARWESAVAASLATILKTKAVTQATARSQRPPSESPELTIDR